MTGLRVTFIQWNIPHTEHLIPIFQKAKLRLLVNCLGPPPPFFLVIQKFSTLLIQQTFTDHLLQAALGADPDPALKIISVLRWN